MNKNIQNIDNMGFYDIGKYKLPEWKWVLKFEEYSDRVSDYIKKISIYLVRYLILNI